MLGSTIQKVFFNYGRLAQFGLVAWNPGKTLDQWPFQDPKLEVPTIYKAYSLGLNFSQYPHNSYGQKQYLHVLDPEELSLTWWQPNP